LLTRRRSRQHQYAFRAAVLLYREGTSIVRNARLDIDLGKPMQRLRAGILTSKTTMGTVAALVNQRTNSPARGQRGSPVRWEFAIAAVDAFHFEFR
jgi:hypothetical protein